MTRSITISCPPEIADAIVERADGRPGVLGIARQRGGSLRPPGDVLTLHVTNEALIDLRQDLDAVGVIASGGSVATAEPRAFRSQAQEASAERETNEASPDEMSALLRRESNISQNYLGLMALSGGVAAVGLYTDTLHLVVGGMLLAPGFIPLARMPLAVTTSSRALATRGASSTLVGYAAMALAAALVYLALRLIDPARPAGLEGRTWVGYWSTPTWTGALVALLASAAGALVISSLRSVLETGVMVALALVPGMAVAGMALAAGDLDLAAAGLARWAIDAGLVMGGGLLVFSLKRALVHPRGARRSATRHRARPRGGAP